MATESPKSNPINPDPVMTERRRLKDRRTRATKPISRYTFVGRRKKSQRFGELDNYYVDRYELHLLIMTGLIIVFCFLDVYFTLEILRFGGTESNLLMSILMEKNLALSLIVKFFLTVIGTVFLLLHKNFRILSAIKTHVFIYLIFSVYFVLILYELGVFILIKGV
jgi:hypothetical protein